MAKIQFGVKFYHNGQPRANPPTAQELIKPYERILKEAGLQTQLVLAEWVKDRIIELITTQEVAWPELDPNYVKQKISEGLDERMLIAYGTYLSKMQVVEVAPGTYRIGPDPEEMMETADMTWGLFMSIHEFGSLVRNIKARPHWSIVYDELDQNIKTMLEVTFSDKLAALLSKVPGLVNLLTMFREKILKSNKGKSSIRGF